VTTLLEEERRIDAMAETSHAGNGVIWCHEPAMGTRHPSIAQVEPVLLVKQALDILLKVAASVRIEVSVVRIVLLEVVEHGQEGRAKPRRWRDYASSHRRRANVGGNRCAALPVANEKALAGASG